MSSCGRSQETFCCRMGVLSALHKKETPSQCSSCLQQFMKKQLRQTTGSSFSNPQAPYLSQLCEVLPVPSELWQQKAFKYPGVYMCMGTLTADVPEGQTQELEVMCLQVLQLCIYPEGLSHMYLRTAHWPV